jgi:hypothetical protein
MTAPTPAPLTTLEHNKLLKMVNLLNTPENGYSESVRGMNPDQVRAELAVQLPKLIADAMNRQLHENTNLAFVQNRLALISADLEVLTATN